MLGKIFNSAKYHCNQKIKNTIYKNPYFKANRFSLLERLFIYLADNLGYFFVLLFALIAILTGVVSFLYSIYSCEYCAGDFLPDIKKWQSDIFSSNFSLLTFLLPLVITFISRVLQGKSSDEAIQNMYDELSGWQLILYSVPLQTIFHVLTPFYPQEFQKILPLIIIIWFSVNILLSFWFVRQTVKFLSLKKQMHNINRYIINILANHVREILLRNFCTALNNSLIGKISEDNIELNTNPFTNNELEHKLVKTSKNPIVITNVYYRTLNWGIKLWVRQAKKQTDVAKPILSVNFIANRDAINEIVVAQTNLKKTTFLYRWLIEFSVRTTTFTEESVSNVDQIIIMLFHQLEDALKDNNESSFENAIDKFINYYREIESSMYFINDNNEADNWLLLSKTFYSKNILDIFIEQFRDISQQVVNKIASNVNFFLEWCRFYGKLFNIYNKDKSQLNLQIIKQYINNNYYIWHDLMLSTAGYNLSDRMIDSAIKIFIGYWERYNKIIRVDDERSITDINFSIIQKHLECTSYMVISALKNNNQQATKWAIDSLVYWHKNFFIEYQHDHLKRQNKIITPELFLDPEKLVANSTRNADNLKKDINQLKEIVTKIEDKKDIALFNYWIDIRLLTAAYIMSCRDIKDSKDHIDRLLNNDRLEANADKITEGKISDVDELLDAYLRQNNFWIQEYDSNNIFAKHLRSLSGIEQPEWILGRCYGSTGTVEGRYLISFYQVIGIGLTTNNEFSFDTWLQLLKNENVPGYYLDNIKNSLTKLTNINDEIITKVCIYFNIDEEEANQRKGDFENSINKFIKQLQDEINETIKNANIDNGKLIQLGLGASKDTFTIENGPLPVNLFKNIGDPTTFDDNKLNTISIRNFHKIDICTGNVIGKATLRNDEFKDCIAEQVTINCFNQLLDNINNLQENKFANNLSLLEQAVEDSAKIIDQGLTPIMFISSLELWQLHDLNKNLRFNIKVETGRGGFYICHVENIAVYKYPYKKDNFSILVPQEIFKKITIKKFDENRYVNFKPEDENAIVGDLIVKFGIDCEFDNSHNCAFKYSTDESQN